VGSRNISARRPNENATVEKLEGKRVRPEARRKDLREADDGEVLEVPAVRVISLYC
jgi:hypothetical protein